MSDKMSFKDACQELGVSEAELEQLVAAGEIASVKEGDTLFFTQEAIESFKESRDDPTVLLADEEINLLEDDDEIDLLADDSLAAAPAEESSLDADIQLDGDEILAVDDAADGSDALLDMDEMDLLSDDDTEATTPVPTASNAELDAELADAETAPVGELGDDTLLDTELLDFGDDDGEGFDLDAVDDDDDFDDETSILRGGGARVMQMKRKESHAAWTALLAVACFLMLLPLGVLVNIMFLRSAESYHASGDSAWIDSLNVLAPVVQWIAGLF